MPGLDEMSVKEAVTMSINSLVQARNMLESEYAGDPNIGQYAGLIDEAMGPLGELYKMLEQEHGISRAAPPETPSE